MRRVAVGSNFRARNKGWCTCLSLARALLLGLLLPAFVALAGSADAQQQPRRGGRQPPIAGSQIQSKTEVIVPAKPGEAPESIQADVHTRSVSITSSFTGTEIVVFGAVDNSRQTSPESGYYDVVIVLEGAPTELVARRKSNVAGIWVNTQSLTFDSVPSYYAIASTRPLDEIASQNVLSEQDIGFGAVRMAPVKGWETGLITADLEDFRSAVIRVKRLAGLYKQEDYDVVFIGRSLFRAAISLPPNVPVGRLVARAALFREGRFLASYTTKVNLERQGLERFLYDFAIYRPVAYGLVTISLALAAGLAASAMFQRART